MDYKKDFKKQIQNSLSLLIFDKRRRLDLSKKSKQIIDGFTTHLIVDYFEEYHLKIILKVERIDEQ